MDHFFSFHYIYLYQRACHSPYDGNEEGKKKLIALEFRCMIQQQIHDNPSLFGSLHKRVYGCEREDVLAYNDAAWVQWLHSVSPSYSTGRLVARSSCTPICCAASFTA